MSYQTTMEDFLNNKERINRVNFIVSSINNTNANSCYGSACSKNNHNYNMYSCDRNYICPSVSYTTYNDNSCSTGTSTPY